MTTQEFSIEFDILYNNLASNSAPPVNEYEKSVFLTKAQSDIVLELYSGRNSLGLSFESSEEARKYLLPLIKYYDRTEGIISNYDVTYKCYKHYIYRPVDDTTSWNALRPGLATIREELHVETVDEDNNPIEGNIPIILVTHDTLDSTLKNPFKRPKGVKRALRLDSNQAEGANKTNGSTTIIYTEVPISNLTYREWYLAKPTPIILDNIRDESLTIDNINVARKEGKDGEEVIKGNPKECILSPMLHNMILERAVLLAKMAYVGGQVQQLQQSQE